jgi:CheY-like chemotaxis protein
VENTCISILKFSSFIKIDRITFKESLRRLEATATANELTGGDQIMAELSRMEVKAHPDIAFLDINVRRINEMLALRKIRQNKAFINVHIVLQTASKQWRDECMALGTDDYFCKSACFSSR